MRGSLDFRITKHTATTYEESHTGVNHNLSVVHLLCCCPDTYHRHRNAFLNPRQGDNNEVSFDIYYEPRFSENFFPGTKMSLGEIQHLEWDDREPINQVKLWAIPFMKSQGDLGECLESSLKLGII